MLRKWEMMIDISCLTLEILFNYSSFCKIKVELHSIALKPEWNPPPQLKVSNKNWITENVSLCHSKWYHTRQKWILSKNIHINNRGKEKILKSHLLYPKWTNSEHMYQVRERKRCKKAWTRAMCKLKRQHNWKKRTAPNVSNWIFFFFLFFPPETTFLSNHKYST